MRYLEEQIDRLMAADILKNVAVKVGRNEDVLYETYRSATGRFDELTMVDMASVSKILCTTSLALMALEEGRFALDTPVSRFYGSGEDWTILHLLTHTIGIGHKQLNKEGITRETVAEAILSIPRDLPAGQDVLYSCPAFILLGCLLEKIYDKPLEELFSERVCAPLGLEYTRYLPTERENILNANDRAELCGVVNDYNCRHLGGVAGNAGVFSNIRDMSIYAKALLSGFPLVREETFRRATANYTAEKSASRGLGYLYVDERYDQTGGLFPTGSFGHCGHTGQSVFVHRESGLYVIVLSDATKTVHSRKGSYDEVIAMRGALHAAIKKDLEEAK